MTKKINIFEKKHKDAKNKLSRSYSWKFVAGVVFVFAIAFGIPAFVFTCLANTSQMASEKFDKWSQENYEQAHKDLEKNNTDWLNSANETAVEFSKANKRISLYADEDDFIRVDSYVADWKPNEQIK